MTVPRALALAGAMVLLATACQGRPHPGGGSPPAGPGTHAPSSPKAGAPPNTIPPTTGGLIGLSPRAAIVTIRRPRRSVTLPPQDVGDTLRAVQDTLAEATALSREPDGPRLLANLRMNAHLLDITLWTPQTLFVGGRRLGGVSAILIPFTGAWQSRVLLVRAGEVDASAPLIWSAPLATLERVVEAPALRP